MPFLYVFEMVHALADRYGARIIGTELVGLTPGKALPGCAALNLKSGIQGAWLNVCININGMSDQAFADEYRAKGQAILDKALPMADAAYAAILEQCNS